MMTQGANFYLIDAETRHQIFIQRFAGGVYKDVEPVLKRLKKDIFARLSVETDQDLIYRMRSLNADLDDIFLSQNAAFGMSITNKLEQLAQYEVGFQARLLGSVVSVETARPTIEQVLSSVTSKKVSLISGNRRESLTIEGLVEKFFKSKSQTIQNAIAAGVIEGMPTDKIIKNVTTSIDKRIMREAEALVRTVTNHCATTARAETMRKNADILEGDRFIATLDARTTMTCAGFDGKVFLLDEGPVPPLHYNCRSTRIPVVKSVFQLPGFDGERPQKGDDGPGVTSGKTTYNSFLKRQSSEFQNEVLGPERAKLFRSGMNVDRFTDPQGRVYSLEELKAMDERFN